MSHSISPAARLAGALTGLALVLAAFSARPARAQDKDQDPAAPRDVACGSLQGAVAEVRGHLRLADGTDPRQARITTFNGRDTLVAAPGSDGAYCVPVVRSTNGTWISVFATAPKAAPQVYNVRVGLGAPAGTLPQLQGPSFQLVPAPRPDLGYVIGVAYIGVSGGRPVWNEGIGEYDRGLDIDAAGTVEAKLKTNGQGVYLAPLPPGTYRLTTRRNVVVEGVDVAPGTTTLRPIDSGLQIVF